MDRYILKNRIPVPTDDIYEWGLMWRSSDRIVKQEMVGDVRISTVFLGLDHNFLSALGEGRPLLFETMIFGGKHDQYQERYSTWDEAEVGHRVAVQLVMEDKP